MREKIEKMSIKWKKKKKDICIYQEWRLKLELDL